MQRAAMPITPPSDAMLEPWPYPFWVAHRGAGKLAPENTLAAFRVGASHGYRAFECDVKLSSDDQPFLLHDATLDRTANSRGLAGQHPWAVLSRADVGSWHSRTYAGEPPPSLEAIARFVRANQFDLNIEIKPTPGTERHTGHVVGEAVLTLWEGAERWPLFSSFQPDALAGAQETAPQVPRALLLDTLWEGWERVAASLGCRAIVTNYGVMSRELINQSHRSGWRVLVYTVNDPSPAQWLQGLGVDGIITDAVDRFSPHPR